MFEFDFLGDKIVCEKHDSLPATNSANAQELVAISVTDLQSYADRLDDDRLMTLNSHQKIVYLRAPRVPSLEGDPKLQQRDIVQGKYYGGLKVWSCTVDICSFVTSHGEMFVGKRIIEIGCGQGLCGIAAILCMASHVTFHDFNSEVLELCTKPNVVLNCASRSQSCTLSFSSGDWDEFAVTDDQKYDLLLGSDVTFDIESCEKVSRLLGRILKVNGIAVLGMKDFYFGTNGGRQEFESALSRNCPQMNVSVQDVPCGNEMKRIVLIVQR